MQSLAAVTPPPTELIVVADGEPESTVDLARRFNASVLRTPEAKGPAHARNLGANCAKGDILLFIDADVTVQPDIVTRITVFFEQHSGYDALIGSYDDQPGASNFLSVYKNLSHHFIHQHSRPDASTFWGACGAIRRDVFLQSGGFDERYAMPSIEDIELGNRLIDAGHNIRLERSLQVKHLKEWRPRSLFKSDYFARALPWSRLILERGRMPDDLNLSWRNRLSVALTFLNLNCFVAGFLVPWLFLISFCCSAALLWMHKTYYLFFMEKHGVIFTFKAIVWHWFSFLYSGLAFGWTVLSSTGRNPATHPGKVSDPSPR